MNKTIPCFICGVAVKLHDEEAIAALCNKHKTKKNVEKLKNTSTSQLLRVLNDGVKQELEANKTETTNQIQSLKDQWAQLEAQLKNQETIIQSPISVEPVGKINQYGEVI